MASAIEVENKRLYDIGDRLSELENDIVVLFRDIDRGPDLTAEGERAFGMLGAVKSLLVIATEIYPYHSDEA